MAILVDTSIFLRNRSFTYLFIGQFVSFIGTMITSVALPYQIYHLTHSTLMVGLLSLCQLLPLLFTALIGGVLADRYDRRKLLIMAEVILTFCCLLLVWNASLPSPYLSILFLVAPLMSAVTGLHRPALESMVQQLVHKNDLSAVSALSSIKVNIAMIGGPAIGGLMIASMGLMLTYVMDVMSFAISLTALMLITEMPKPISSSEESVWSALLSGFRYAVSRQELVGTYCVDFIAMIFGMPTALFPAIAAAHGGATMLGLLYAAPAVGALMISFFSGWTKRVRRHGVAIAISASLWGVAIILFGLSHSIISALFFLALAGAFDGVSGIFRMTMWNETIPHELRGRLAGIEMISYLSGPRLGDAEAGLVAASFGIGISIVSGGMLCVLGVLVCSLCLPSFWRYRSVETT